MINAAYLWGVTVGAVGALIVALILKGLWEMIKIELELIVLRRWREILEEKQFESINKSVSGNGLFYEKLLKAKK